MPRLRKVLLNKTVVFVTTSTEEGLPFPPNPLVNSVLESCLARAQSLHPVRICHKVFESTHAHFLFLVSNPDDIPGFMERFKTESGHAVNKILGRQKKTIWCKGYDSPVLLTLEDVIEKIVYLYTNPSKDDLEDSIDKFPGLSTWKAYRTGGHFKSCPWIRRSAIEKLSSTSRSLQQFRKLANKLKREASTSHTLRVFPDAWMECFGITEPKEREQINREIIRKIRAREREHRERRVNENKSILGRDRLMLQPMDAPYTPERTGRKMWCICSDKALRKEFITRVKALVARARDVYGRWKLGDFSLPFPPGLFPPGMPKLAEPYGIAALF